ncbi:MAG: rhomboid family intramembrane serine protease [Saprospiraceae bacterium]
MSFNNYNRGMQITPVVRDLLIINILFFIGTQFSDTVSSMLALYYPSSENFRTYQLVTHFFMHANLMHLAFNMIGLYSIGMMLEMVWGGKRFLTYYFICAFGAAAVHLGMTYWEFFQLESLMKTYIAQPDLDAAITFFKRTGFELNSEDSSVIQAQMSEIIKRRADIPMVGASGALYGLLAAVWYMFPETAFFIYFIPVPIKAKYLVPVILVLDLFMGFSRFGGDNVAHFAHIGGAVVGLIVLLLWYKKSIVR